MYAHPLNWLLLTILVAAGGIVRHLLNIRFTYRHWLPALGGTIAATMVAIYALSARPLPARDFDVVGEAVSFEAAHAVIQQRCTVCHSASPADRTFGPAPGGVAFDTPEQVRALVERIRVRAVETETMPPANATWMTPSERALLARWTAAPDEAIR